MGGRQAGGPGGRAGQQRKSMGEIMGELVTKALEDYDQAAAAAMGARIVQVGGLWGWYLWRRRGSSGRGGHDQAAAAARAPPIAQATK